MQFFLVFLAFYAAFFSNYPGWQLTTQLAALVLMAAVPLPDLFRRRIRPEPPTAFELVLVASCLVSLLVASLGNNTYSFNYTLVFLFTTVALALASRTITLRLIFSALSWAYLAVIATQFIFNGPSFLRALGFGATDYAYRYRPLGLEPDLAGLLFGAGMLVLGIRAMAFSGFLRFLHYSGAVLCLTIILAASARAALLAAFVAIAAWSLPRLKAAAKWWSSPIGLTLAFLAFLGLVIYSDALLTYISNVLELNSHLRGFGSGASGRTRLWSRGIALLNSRDFGQLLTGTGMRSATSASIGFYTESSYMTILLENGMVLGSLIIAFFFTRLVMLARHEIFGQQTGIGLSAMVFVMLLYIVTQSVFNRYLLAIGNPLSLCVLLVMIKTSSRTVWREGLR